MITDTTRLRRMFGLLRGHEVRTAEAVAAGVVISKEGGVRVVWIAPTRAAAAHVLVLAAAGVGKSIVVAFASATEFINGFSGMDNDGGAIILDPKGDLAKAFCAALCFLAPQLLDRVTILDPFSPSGFEFNLNHLRTHVPNDIRGLQLAGLVAEVSTGVGAQKHLGAGARQLDVLGNCLLGALTTDRPGASPLLALDALTEPDGMKRLSALTSSARARSFLESAELSGELQASSAARLRTAFSATEQLERLIGAPGCIDIQALCGPGQIVIINLGRPIGGLGSLIEFWGNLLLRQFVDHLLSRPSPWDGHHTRLIIDEAQLVAPVLSDVAEVILTTGRSRGISLVTMTQTIALLSRESPALVRCLEANVPHKIVGRIAASDAELLSRELTNSPGIDETRAKVREHFVSKITNLLDRHFVSLVPGKTTTFEGVQLDLNAWDEAAVRQTQALEAAARRFAVPDGAPPRARLQDLAPRADTRRHGQSSAAQHRGPPRSRWG